jgi:ABC-type multidrug transport system ATPase subunit
VAILHRGKLVGVGQIAELLKRQSGFEAVIESCPAAHLPSLQTMAAGTVTASGAHHRLELAEEKVPEFLGYCAGNGVRLLSLTPLRVSLEDYFVELVRSGGSASETAAVSTGSS